MRYAAPDGDGPVRRPRPTTRRKQPKGSPKSRPKVVLNRPPKAKIRRRGRNRRTRWDDRPWFKALVRVTLAAIAAIAAGCLHLGTR
jgi:hypothetical protein